jgi:hypothetical protein
MRVKVDDKVLSRPQGQACSPLSWGPQGAATNHELAAIAGYARLGEIRDRGGDFERVQVDGSTHMYRLTRPPMT